MTESAILDPPDEAIAELSRSSPENPFLTAGYAAARRRLGQKTWLLRRHLNGRWQPASVGFESGGRRRRLELPSIPAVPPGDPFWSDLLALSRARRVAELALDSFGAIGARLPDDLPTTRRWTRAEHLLDLAPSDLLVGCERTHRQRVRQAAKKGCVLRWTGDPAALADHGRLIGASAARRRGVDSSGDADFDGAKTMLDWHRTLLETGAGELALVSLDGEAVASALVLRTPRAGYLQSSGSSTAGKSIGAHHFMVIEIATQLRTRGCSSLNLGGTRSEETGLRDFKVRFGASTVEAEVGRVEWPRWSARLAGRLAGWYRRLSGQRPT